MTLHGVETLKLDRFNWAIVNAVLAGKGLLAKALLTPLQLPLLADVEERRDRLQLLPACIAKVDIQARDILFTTFA